MLPLLAAISRELEERGAALVEIDARLQALRAQPNKDGRLLRALVAEAANHRRAIRLGHAELERLGCSVVGTNPLTIRIPTQEGLRRRSLVWQAPQAGAD